MTVLTLVGFVIAAPYGIVWVAVVHLIANGVRVVVRVLYANRVVGTTIAEVARAVAPAFVVAGGVTLFGLPVRLATSAGWPAFLLISGACAVGGLIGAAACGRTVFDELRALGRYIRLSST